MRPVVMVLCDGGLSLALPLMWAFYELHSLNRKPPPDDRPPPIVPRILPPDLTAAPRPRVRVLEDA